MKKTGGFMFGFIVGTLNGIIIVASLVTGFALGVYGSSEKKKDKDKLLSYEDLYQKGSLGLDETGDDK